MCMLGGTRTHTSFRRLFVRLIAEQILILFRATLLRVVLDVLIAESDYVMVVTTFIETTL
jgi:hypothetical protein